MPPESPEDAITQDEIYGTASAPTLPWCPDVPKTEPKRNAFTTLMSKKRPQNSPPSFSSHPSKSKTPSSSKPFFRGRDGLGAYINKPEDYPSSRVICYDSEFVTIHDLYPKSSVHILLLPRAPKYQYLHPFDAFDDPAFLTQCRLQAEKTKGIAGAELRRKFGGFSKLDERREAVLNGECELEDGEEMPVGRDWEKEIRVGVHAHPSMSHLHIHVISVDRYSECLKHRKHYNSFATGFFVLLDDFPLGKQDVRRWPGREGFLKEEFRCWRCGERFGRSFVKLKEHLLVEFESWKRE